jgi:hypothetical protein
MLYDFLREEKLKILPVTGFAVFEYLEMGRVF